MKDKEKDSALDAVFKILRWRGKYQVIQCIFASVPQLFIAFHVMAVIFIARDVPYQCSVPDNMSSLLPYGFEDINSSEVVYGMCNIEVSNNISGEVVTMTAPCLTGHTYSKPKKLSLAAEWDIVCDREAMADLLQTVMMIGMAVGAVVFTYIADRKGRKPVHITCGIIFAALGFVEAVSPDYTVFAVARFSRGAFQQGYLMTAYIISLEVMPQKRRAVACLLQELSWVSGVVLITPVCYLMRDVGWRYTQTVLSLGPIYCLVLYWILDETLRWLTANGKFSEAESIVRKAAKMNKVEPEMVLAVFHERVLRKLPKVDEKHDNKECETSHVPLLSVGDKERLDEKNMLSEDKNRKDKTTAKYTLLDIIKHKKLLCISVIMWFTWFTNVLTYYGLHMTSSSLHDNFYIGYLVNGLVEFPSKFTCYFAIQRLGRKRSSAIFHGLAGISLIISALVGSLTERSEATKATVMVFTLIGKFAITTSFSLIYIQTPELYPTTLRNLGLGISSMSARIGGMLSPFARLLARHLSWGPGAVFGSCCFVVTILIRFLPETRGRELPQTVEEISNWYKTSTKPKEATVPNSSEESHL